jgi:hypothetical protein
MTAKNQGLGCRGGNAARRYFASPARTVMTVAVMLTLIAASGCGSTQSSGGSASGQSSSGGSASGQSSSGGSASGQSSSGGAGTTGSLAQWTQQYGPDVTALLSAADNDMGQINISISSCNSNSQFCITPDCSDTVNAANTLQSDRAPSDATVANELHAGALELSMAAGQCASVQDFVQGIANIGNAAQALGLSPNG